MPPLFPSAPGLPAGGVVLYFSNRHREAEEKRCPRPSSCPLPVSGASTFPPHYGGLFALFFYSFQPLCPSVPTVFYMCVHTVTQGEREAAKAACFTPGAQRGERCGGGLPAPGPLRIHLPNKVECHHVTLCARSCPPSHAGAVHLNVFITKMEARAVGKGRL